MKLKTLLVLVASMFMTVAANAEWIKPTQKGSDPETGKQYYIVNVEAQQYLNAAKVWFSWATSAGLDDKGCAFELTKNADGTWKFTNRQTHDGKFVFISGNGVDPDGEMHVDGANPNNWNLVKLANGNYTIAPNDHEGYWGWKGAESDFPNAVNCYLEEGAIEWIFVEKEYKNAYANAMDLTEAIAEAKELGVDVTEEQAVLDNEESTAEQLGEAVTAVKSKVIEAKLDKASASNPVDISALIPGVNLDNVTEASEKINKYWTRIFTGDGTTGSIRKNTWSNEGNDDGTLMKTPFLENWVGRGSELSDQICKIDTVKELRAGVYKVTARVRTYNESGAETITGPSIFGNFWSNPVISEDKEPSAEISTGEEGYFTFNGMLGYYNPEATTYALVGNDGTLTFGLQLENANYNWQAHKDYKVYYLGKDADALALVEGMKLSIEELDDDAQLTVSIKEKVNEQIAIIKDNESFETVAEAIATYNAMLPEVDANKAAWKDFVEFSATVRATALDKGLNGADPNVKALKAYVNNGELDDFIDDKEATTEEIAAEKARLNELLEACKNAMGDGADVTRYLTNPDFSKGATGWSGAPTINSSCGEKYGTKEFDVYQIVKNAPVGLYEISMQGFYRELRDDGADKAAWYNYFEATEDAYTKKDPAPAPLAYVYLNDMQTALQCVYDFRQDYLYNEETQTGTSELYGSGYSVDPYNKYCYPNNMANAAAAFAKDAYKVSAYGIVASAGDEMKIGVKGDLKSGPNWAIFDNFKLTYRAQNEEVINKLLPTIKARIDLTQKMGKDVKEEAQEAMKIAEEATDNDAKFNALAKLATADSKIIASVALFKQLAEKQGELATALTETEASEAIQEEVGNFNSLLESEIAGGTLTDADAKERMATVDLMIMKLSVPESLVEDIRAEVESATMDNRVDITHFIANPSFEENGQKEVQDIIGWKQSGSINFQTQSNTSFGKTGSYYAERWHVDGTLDMSQAICLPCGTYLLTVDGHASEPVGAVLYANDKEAAFTNSTDATAPNTESILMFVEDGTFVKYGVKGTLTSSTWFALDNFTLTCVAYGEDVTAVKDVQAVKAITAAKVAKFFRKGKLVILKDGKYYNAAGAAVK